MAAMIVIVFRVLNCAFTRSRTFIVGKKILKPCAHSGLVIVNENCRNRQELWNSFQSLLISTSFLFRYYFVHLKLAQFINRQMQNWV